MASKAKAKKKSVEKAEDAKGYLPIDGIAPKRFPALDQQCERLMESRNKVTKAREAEKDVHMKLINMMHEREINSYIHTESGKRFDIEAPEKVHFKNLEKKPTTEGNGINPESENDTEDEPLDEKADADEKDAKAEK